jgi:hypothetical protein
MRSLVVALSSLALFACSTGEGSGSVRSDRLFMKNCWNGPFDLQPDFFGTIPFADSQQIRVQRGDRNIEVSDGLVLVVNDVAKIRSSQLGTPIPLGLPIGVKPPGFPPRVEMVPPQVSLSLYLYATCHLQNGGLNSVSGSITFTHLFSGDRNENSADERLTEAHFDALVTDPRDAKLIAASPSTGGNPGDGGATEAGPPVAADAGPLSPGSSGVDGGTVITYGSVTVDYGADQTSRVTGDFQFYFQRGIPAQPFP